MTIDSTPPAGSNAVRAYPAETAVGHAVSTLINRVIVPVETAFNTELERALEKLTGHAVFNAYSRPPMAPRFRDPIVLITGLLMRPSSYDAMAKHFTASADVRTVAVYNCADGRFHRDRPNGTVIDPRALKRIAVFDVSFPDPEASVKVKRGQLGAALDAIHDAVGRDLHVVAHSQGNQVFQAALDDRNQAGKPAIVESYANIDGVTNGTLIGKIGAIAGGIAGVKDAGAEVEFGAPLIERLKADWPEIRTQIKGDVTTVTVTGAPTLGSDGKVHTGSGFNTVQDTSLPGSDVVALRNPDPLLTAHLVETGMPGITGAVQDHLIKDEARKAKEA